MMRKHLGLAVFFIILAAEYAFLIGYLRFHTKGYEIVNVQGSSMFPTLKNGQKAIINYNIPEANLTNMIVVFGDTRICHRCIKDEGQWLTFKGDNASTFEHATRDELKAIFIKVTQDPFLDSLLLGMQ